MLDVRGRAFLLGVFGYLRSRFPTARDVGSQGFFDIYGRFRILSSFPSLLYHQITHKFSSPRRRSFHTSHKDKLGDEPYAPKDPAINYCHTDIQTPDYSRPADGSGTVYTRSHQCSSTTTSIRYGTRSMKSLDRTISQSSCHWD